MIRVRLNLHSALGSQRDAWLGAIDIVNDGTGSATKGNYVVTLYDRAGRPWKRGRVEGFPRKRLLAHDLLLRALLAAIGDRA